MKRTMMFGPVKSGASEEEILAFCEEHLVHCKAPKSVEFVDSLPKNPQGKILNRELRERYWAGLDRQL